PVARDGARGQGRQGRRVLGVPRGARALGQGEATERDRGEGGRADAVTRLRPVTRPLTGSVTAPVEARAVGAILVDLASSPRRARGALVAAAVDVRLVAVLHAVAAHGGRARVLDAPHGVSAGVVAGAGVHRVLVDRRLSVRWVLPCVEPEHA